MHLLTALILTTFASFSFAAITLNIQDLPGDFHDPSLSSQVQPTSLQGLYQGECIQNSVVQKEALYIDTFTNTRGVTNILPISTAQLYGGDQIPAALAYLWTPQKQNLNRIAAVVSQGLSGADNNVGILDKGSDFSSLYESELSEDKKSWRLLTHQVLDSQSSNGVSNPPALQGCQYGRVNGVFKYQNCVRANDVTEFKIVRGTLVSHRTAEAVGNPMNNLSFYLPAVSMYCQWNKIL